MAVPKSKPSKRRSRNRRSANMKIKLHNLSTCSSCGVSKISHQVCLKCGYYKDRIVLDVDKLSYRYKYL